MENVFGPGWLSFNWLPSAIQIILSKLQRDKGEKMYENNFYTAN